MLALAFGLASASVAGLLRLPWLDIGTAGLIGLLVGVVDWVSATRPRLREANETISAMLAATVAILVAKFVGRSEEHTSDLQSLMSTAYAVFCWKTKTHIYE